MALNFAPTFGRVGGAVGGIGGGIMGRLGSLLEPLDYARQAALNIPDKLGEGDFLGALPGLAGLGLGAGLAATGFGLPVAAAAGTVMGAFGQGAGKLYDSYQQPTPEGEPAEQHFQARTTGELSKAMGWDPDTMEGSLVGMGLGMATDPLTYTGGTIGRAIARGFAPGLENMARLRGPGYGGGAEKIMTTPESFALSSERAAIRAPRQMQEIAGSPYGPRVMAEIPPGSTPLGAGMEAATFRTPDGHVVRISGGNQTWDTLTGRGFNGDPMTGTRFPIEGGDVMFPHIDPLESAGMAPPLPRQQSPMILQPARSVAIGPYRVEHLPSVDHIPTRMVEGAMDYTPQAEALEEAFRNAQPVMQREAMRASGLSRDATMIDPHIGNMGLTREGNILYHDAGSLGGVGPAIEQLPGSPPTSRMTNWLLDALGANRGVQSELAESLANTGAQGFSPEQIMAIRQQMYGPNRVYRGANLLPNRPDLPATVKG